MPQTEIRREQALRATLAARLAQHPMALDQYQRRSKLSPGYTITVEALDNARRQSETAAANYQEAIASRDNAALNVRRTEVRRQAKPPTELPLLRQ